MAHRSLNSSVEDIRTLTATPKLFRSKCGYIMAMGVSLNRPIEELHDFIDRSKVGFIPVSMISSIRHLIMAAHRACRAFKEGKNIADAFVYELAICLTGSREISRIRSQIIQKLDDYVLVIIDSSPLACKDHLLSLLYSAAISPKNVEFPPRFIDLPTCSGLEDTLSMENGAIVELDR